MKRAKTVFLGVGLVTTLLVLMGGTVLAGPGTTYEGVTVLTFSANPATLSGDSAPDVTITTTTTTPPGGESLIGEGKVMIELATDGLGNPVPASTVGIVWVALNDPGQNPVNGVTTLDVDLDGLGFVDGTVGAFRAHYVTGGGQNKVGTHFSEPVDLTAVMPSCEWFPETAWAAGPRYIAQGNWATYTPYESGNAVNLWAGQDMDAGDVYFSAVDGGHVTITITLNQGLPSMSLRFIS